MRTYNNSIVTKFDTNANGNAGAGKSVTVLLTGTQTLADLFDTALQPIGNPVIADDDGNYTFTIDDGTYDVVIDKGLPTEESLLQEQIANIVTNPPPSTTGLVRNFDELSSAVTSLTLFNGDACNIKERTTGNGGGAIWDAVLASTVTANTFNIVQCTGVPALALVLRSPTMLSAGATDSIDSTPVAIALNATMKNIVFDADNTFTLQNWVPLAGTTIHAKGATLNRWNDDQHGATGSAATIVNENDSVVINGGTHGLGAGATKGLAWTGSVLIDGGSIKFNGGVYRDTWGSIFGNLTQTASNVAQNVSLLNLQIHDNVHNTYLADIKDLIVDGCFSYNSDRDGLRTFRNTSNITITNNHIYDNGDPGAAGQSRDGMDLFVEGTKCVITGNYIYNNLVAGMDIKKNDSEPVVDGDKQYVVSGNFIYLNGDDGISCEDNTAAALGIRDMLFQANHIYSNGGLGISAKILSMGKILDNYIYDNGLSGIRAEDCIDTDLRGNHIHNNGTLLTGGFRTGLTLLNCVNGNMTDNTIKKGTGTSQTEGVVSSGSTVRIYDNDIQDHATANFNCDTSARGKTISVKVENTTAVQPIYAMLRNLCLIRGSLAVNNTITTTDLRLGTRNLTTGAFASTVVFSAGFTNGTAWANKDIGAFSAADAKINGDELLTVQLSPIISGFVQGVLNIDYCD